jgi:hypothetical protein
MGTISRICRVFAATALAVLSGCAVQSGTNGVSPAANGVTGNVHGGQQPVAFSTVQLYTVGTTADGSAAAPLLTQTVTSDAGGNFTLTGLYSCSGATLVYLTASGGQPGPGITNPNLAMMTALGPCSSLTPSTFIQINEVTTVAAVSALAPFMTGYSAVGSNSGDVSALTNAFTLASELVNTATGQAPGSNVPAGMAVPATLMNTLANVVAACVNSAGGVSGDGSACGSLFALTTPSGGSHPTDTVGAMLDLAQNPALNTPALFNLITPAAPFQPQLTGAPPAFQVQLLPAPSLLNPSSVSFPATPLGGTAQAQTVSLTNTTTAAITVDSIGASGNFQQTNNCPATLSKGSFCTIQVTFSPTAIPSQTGLLSVSGGGAYTAIPLSGSGIASSTGPVTLSPSSLTFYERGVAQAVTLTNFGTNPLGIAAIQFDSPNYTQVNNCGSSLSGQSVCTIYISAGPAMGTFSGAMTVIDSDTSDVQAVSLSTDAAYKTVRDGGITPLQGNSVALNFFGDAYLNTSGLYDFYGFTSTITGPNSNVWRFPMGNYINGCSTRIPAQVNPPAHSVGCSTYAQMSTFTVGEQYAHLVSNMGDDVLLKGYGAGSAPEFLISQTASPYFLAEPTLDFGPGVTGTSYSKTLYLDNGSTSAVTFVSATPTLTAGPTNNGDFSATISQCPGGLGSLTLNPVVAITVSACTLTVNFQPTALGLRSTTLTVSTTGGLSHSLYITGNGTYAAPTAPPAVDFGNVQVGGTGTQMITVTIPGQHAATAQILETGSPFAIPGSAYCAQGANSCQFSVSFSPSVLGSAQAHLVVTDTVSGLIGTSVLGGIGGVPVVSLSTHSLTFIPRSVGSTSIAQTVMLTNLGNASLLPSLSIGGTNAGDFAQTNNCPASLSPNASCTISITNTPTFVGPSSANLVIVSNAAGSPDTVGLSGTGN